MVSKLIRFAILATLCICASLSNAQIPPAAPAKNPAEAIDVNGALAALGVQNPAPSKRIEIQAPDIIEAGTAFTVKVRSAIPGTDWIALLADRNPKPFVDQFQLTDMASQTQFNVKMQQTSKIRALIRAGGKYYFVTKEIKAATPGCN